MSSYDAIVPVSWSRLTEMVLPAWAALLEHRITEHQFAAELGIRTAASEGWDRYDVDWIAEWPSSAPHVPAGYLAELGWAPGMPFVAADRVRRSALHAAFAKAPDGPLWVAMSLLWEAIQAGACEHLAGHDAFAESETYYGRIHAAPHYQVAGTKNGFGFVRTLFEITWVQELSIYRHVTRASADPVLVELTEALCLATRAFPATVVLCEAPAWPAFDDMLLQGILTPGEVQRLASKLDALTQLVHKQDERGQPDTLFPLFADRVRRSAEQGLALIAVQSGL